MVAAAATVALETLRDLLIEEVKLLSGVKDKVVDLERDILMVRDFLKDAEKWPNRYHPNIMRRRVSDLIDLATSAEDVLEKYAVEITSKRSGANNLITRLKRFICILGECLALHEIGKESAGIMSRMAELTMKFESVRIGEAGSSSFECNGDQLSLRQTYWHVTEEHFVGMKNDIKLLVSRMQNDDRSYRVISICGMGGLGKTTLARKIYQEYASGFEARAWVCITQKLKEKSIFEKILRQLLPPEEDKGRIKGMEDAEILTELYDIQKAKKCLVVLDDIWEIDHWNILKDAFPLAKSKSKILLTTRERDVADIGSVYELECLTENESWDLLQKIALPIFHKSDECSTEDESLELLQKIALPIHESEGLTIANSKQFEALGRELVRKCGCLPLAVSFIGGILKDKNLEEWKKVNNMDMHLMSGKSGESVMLKQVLNLSYDALPYYLKLCFLYLGCFPEDIDIIVEDVYLIWMAEGLISSDYKGRNETLRDVAERYLNELASKCMVQVKITEGFKSCRLHDLVRELCLSKRKEANFFEDSEGKIQRLVINLVEEDACSVAQFKNANLRSLLLLNNQRKYVDINQIWENLIGNALLKSLKVLVLEYCKFKGGKLPDDVRKLVRLKHLSIRCSYLVEVPEFVCKLPSLQSMDLRSGRRITLPNSIDKMGRLRHLFLDSLDLHFTEIYGGRPRLDGLTELETLIGFSSEIFDTNHLLKLTNLRSFGGYVYDIESLSLVVDHFNRLKDKLREARLDIEVTDLSSEKGFHVIDSLMYYPLNHLRIKGRLRRLPIWDPQLLHNLHTLILDGSEIGEDPMKTLQHLPALRNLWLLSKAFVGTVMVCGSEGFPQLKRLFLSDLYNLEEWRVEKGAMQNLSDLTIDLCPNLKMIPEGIIFIASITKLRITTMPSNFMERLREGGGDYHKISRIPFLDF